MIDSAYNDEKDNLEQQLVSYRDLRLPEQKRQRWFPFQPTSSNTQAKIDRSASRRSAAYQGGLPFPPVPPAPGSAETPQQVEPALRARQGIELAAPPVHSNIFSCASAFFANSAKRNVTCKYSTLFVIALLAVVSAYLLTSPVQSDVAPPYQP